MGLVLIPLAIWVVGHRALGPYTHGSNPQAGPLALLGDFWVGLAHGAYTFWVVALGPLILLLFIRLVWALLRPRAAAALPAKPVPTGQRNK